MTEPLPREFFARGSLAVAGDLLGCLVEHAGVTLRITEVEAYAGTSDPGSHAFRGPTPRTEVMFGPAGHLYVYFSYGMHWCANLVCGTQGAAAAVLLRAGEVVQGQDLAQLRRRGERPRPVPERDLARGPARLARSLALDGGQAGLDVCAPDSPLRVRAPDRPRGTVRTGPRVGVAGEGGDGQRYPWRLWLDGEPSVSPYRPGTRRKSSALASASAAASRAAGAAGGRVGHQ